MAVIKKKLRELKNADVRFISLVDRAASRIPFRVLKRDEETEMLDLAKIFKSERTKPEVTGVVVLTQKDEAVAEKVRQSIASAGFSTDSVQKSDDETLCFKQEASGDHALVRLSDEVLVLVTNMPTIEGEFGSVIKTEGFYPDFAFATALLNEKLHEVAQKGDLEGAKALLNSFGEYSAAMLSVPASAFTANTAVNEVVASVQKDDVHGLKPNGTTVTVEKEADYEEVEKKDKKKKKPEEGSPAEEAAETPKEEAVEEAKKEEPAVKEETKEEPVAEVQKSDLEKVMEAISGLKTHVDSTIGGLTQKVEETSTQVKEIASKQEEQKKVLDETQKNHQTLSQKFEGTVIAGAPAGDPAPREEVKKSDEDTDPRTGCFDTALIRKRQR